jgi:eukaryotic-like serine/threonine-protein kinase
MKPNLSSDPRMTCPKSAVLSEFWGGRLALETMKSVADHLTICPPCEAAFHELREEDSVVSKLRRYLTHPTPALDPECEQLAAAARLIPLEATGAITLSEDTRTLPNERRPEEPTPRQFAGYELLQRLGYGGMGVVWRARQVRLNRLVALKMIRFGPAAGDTERERFRLEGEAIARVRHPNIVEVFHAGEQEGQPYFAMELLEGGTLAQRHPEHPYSPRAAAELLHTLALAVQAAHDAGVVHRDLKPSNVMFGAGGVVKVTDFGLAKLVDADGSQTRTGDILGTPCYMAPEQARGQARAIGPRTDVYALGAILYELLSGKAPFRGADRDATLQQVLSGEPAPLPSFNEVKPQQLAAICLKCLQKEPRDRYPTATALAEDLDRWLHDLPTEAKFPGRLARVRGFIRRRAFLATSLGVCGLGAAGGFAGWMLWNPDAAADDLERRLARGESVTLIGESGAPAWSRWPLGKQKSLVSHAADGTVQVRCLDANLLELLRDPRTDHYRFRAEVSHEVDAEDGTGGVGVYFGRHSHPSPNGAIHVFVQVVFNDIHSKADWAKNQNLKHPNAHVPVPKANPLEMMTWECGEETGTVVTSSSTIANPEVVQPHGLNNRMWRSLAIEVAPAEIRVFWDGDNQPALTMPTGRIEKNLRTGIAEAQRMNLPVSDVPVAFVPRGGLGLRVAKAAASFRNVRVEPLG